MCGVVGVLSAEAAPQEARRAELRHMMDAIVHRGPDASGEWLDDQIALGHQRLSILDLTEAGAQPMHAASERFVVVFNGEIYNHEDLRKELSTPPGWRGHSDTETLLACISEWGLDEALRRAAGMFAIAVWDRQRRRLSLARDRIGEKPLYWGWSGRDLVFGSELKAIRRHRAFTGEIDRVALAQYFSRAYVPAPRSIYAGVFKVEPGTIVEIDGAHPGVAPAQPMAADERHGTIAVRRYWSLQEVVEAGRRNPFATEGEALERVEAALQQAVSRQMLSDVPLGAFLSGGVDSSLIVALMQRCSSRPVRTFTVGFSDPAYDESAHAEAVARHLGTEHHVHIATESDARDVIPQLPWMYDEPFADSSQIPTQLVCRGARAGVTVALSGDAGDEMFGGYNRYIWAPRVWRRVGWMPSPVRRLLELGLAMTPAAAWDAVGQLAGVRRAGEKLHRLAGRLRGAESVDALYCNMVAEWLGSPLVHGEGRIERPDFDMARWSRLGLDSAERMMAQDAVSYLPDDIFCKVDRAAMSVSLETRAPFVDPGVIEASWRVPVGMKVRQGTGKWLLRQILYKYVPADLIERPKTGFGVPIGQWLRGPLREWAEELLSPSSLASDGLVDPAVLRATWTQHCAGTRDWTNRIWSALMYLAWRQSTRR